MVAITRSQLKNMSNNNTTTVTNPNKKRKGDPIVLVDSPPPSDSDKEDMDADYLTNDEEYDSDEDEDYLPSDESSTKNEAAGIRSDITKHGYRKDSFIASEDEEDEEDNEYAGSEDGSDDDSDDGSDDDNVIDVKSMLMKAIANKLKPRGSSNKETDIRQTFTEEEETYFESLSKEEQDSLADTYTSVISSENSPVPIKFQILNSNLDNYVKNIALQKYNAMMEADDSSGEFIKLSKWIQTLCNIPFNKYKSMPVDHTKTPSEIKQFLRKTESTLNEEVYGHKNAKSQIMRIVAQWVSNPSSKGNVIGIHGNPGVGKTTLIKNGVCKALDLPFAFIPLGGASDSSFLEGHSYTYEGSSNGKILDVLMKTKVMNPVLYFDELDKVSESKHGREIINLLIHLTDPAQNKSFQDRYFNNIDFDLSRCLIIFTYNNNGMIDPILKDRMITIHTKDYKINDKLEIAKAYLLPSIAKEFNISNVQISDEDIKHVIDLTTSEAGVRNLKRSFERIVSHINLERLLEEKENDNELKIDRSHIDKYLKNNDDDKDEINPSLAHLYT